MSDPNCACVSVLYDPVGGVGVDLANNNVPVSKERWTCSLCEAEFERKVRCTCDENIDDPCMKHYREHQLQDELIVLRNKVREFLNKNVDLLEDYEKVLTQLDTAKQLIKKLLLSADASWYENDAGHDWRLAVDQAQAFLEASDDD